MLEGGRDKVSIDASTLGKLRPILDVVRQINKGPDLRNIIVRILDLALESTGAQRGAVVTFQKGKLKVELARHRSGIQLKKEERGISKTVLLAVQKTGHRVVVNEALSEARFKLVDSVQKMQLRSVLCVPIFLRDKMIGAVYVDDPSRATAFGQREVEVAEILTAHAAIAIENARLYKQSNQDRLTHLWNHAHFEKRLRKEVDRAKANGGKCAVVMIDVDDFKKVNDVYGHEAGNLVLKHVAKTLASTVRSEDIVARAPGPATVARFGGDEFELVLPGAGKEEARLVANRLVKALGNRKLGIDGKVLRLSISVGAAVYPDHAATADDLLVKADEALYVSKRGGKNRAALHGDA
ncbi:MAG: sensor domain-containing diguanylate cyclase [Planctomycetaceae bacterium]|nr:sensor domain-containing diguanylate cyclase [Planctomycetaceae bacterium]